MRGYFRHFVKDYGILAVPLTSLLHEPQIASKKETKQPISWGPEPQQAFEHVNTALLTLLPVVAPPYWTLPFVLHTDASKVGTGAGAALMQIVLHTTGSDQEWVIAYARHHWSRSNERRSITERECLAVIWAVARFRPYLWGRRFTHITECPTLIWHFKNQNLSAKLHRWALHLMDVDVDLQWRPDTNHQAPAALSRLLPQHGAQGRLHP